jgi:hypothetical protein
VKGLQRTRLHRVFFITLLLPLAAAQWACQGGEGPSGEASREMEEILRRIPSGPDLVLYFDQVEAETSPAYRELSRQYLSRPEAQEALDGFVELTGIDPILDMDRVGLAGWIETGGKSDDIQRFVLVSRGSFSGESMEKALTRSDVESRMEGGRRVYSFSVVPGGSPLILTLPKEGTLVFGDEQTARMAVALGEGDGKSLLEDPETMGDLRPELGGKQAWLIIGPSLARKITHGLEGRLPQGQSPVDPARLFRNLERATAWAAFSERAEFQLTGQFVEEQEAELVAKAVRGMLALSRLGLPEGGALTSFLDTIEVESRDGRFTCSSRLTEQQVRDLAEATLQVPRPGSRPVPLPDSQGGN